MLKQTVLSQDAERFKIRWSLKAVLTTLGLFIALVLLATVGKHTGLLRSFGGDVLAVVFVYYGLKSFVQMRVLPLASIALAIGYAVELSQYLAKLNHWVISNPIIRMIVGSTPDWWDVLAYTAGFGFILFVEWRPQAKLLLQAAKAT